MERISEQEKKVSKEKVMRPISWCIDKPCIDDGRVGINIRFFYHNRVNDDKKKYDGQMEIFYDKEEFAPVLRAVEGMDAFLKIQEISKISDIRDEKFNQLNAMLCDLYDKESFAIGSGIYERLSRLVFYDEEYNSVFRSLVRIETILNLLKRPKVFFSEELQELFA